MDQPPATAQTRRPAAAGPVRRIWRRVALLSLAAAALAPAPAAVTLDQLMEDPKLNAKRFASHFESFRYEFNPDVQSPTVFLRRRKGDCDDYAILADRVLSGKGYRTRLIQVRVAGLTVDHAVCYVTEDRAYLDYNNRSVFFTLARSGETIREIATKVAKSFDANWTTASEFVYIDGRKKWVATVVKTDPPDKDPVAGEPGSTPLKIDF